MSNPTTQVLYRIVEKFTPLWYDDGDIVITARRPEIRCYKLHRDVLFVHAPVFLEFLDDKFARGSSFMNNTPAVLVPEHALELDWFLHGL
jgi:hypothetical protein